MHVPTFPPPRRADLALAGLVLTATLFGAAIIWLLSAGFAASADQVAATDAQISQRVLVAGIALGSLVTAAVALLVHLRAQQRARQQVATAQSAAITDQMTGLLNRSGFFTSAEHAVNASIEKGLSASLLFIDLDHFKELNDSYGHAVGDELLKLVAARLTDVCGANALIGRLGGDEFAVCLFDLVSMEDADLAARSICSTLATPASINGHGTVPSASVGYAMAPGDADRIGDLARSADLALYNAKDAGRGSHRGFEHYMLLELDQRREIERLVREAAVNSSFELHYQPLIHATSGRLAGFEALIRLRTSEGRFISPAAFIPIAEEIGMISEIGAWVLDNACMAAKLWPPHLMLAVNLSPLQFRDFSVTDAVKNALRTTDFPPERLQLEITEGLLLLKTDDIMHQLSVLKDLGVTLAMDDFGSGYCSLSYLWKFPFDTIKIDRSFVQALDDPSTLASNVLASVLTLAQSLRLGVTVEGIETQAQGDHVRALGCDTMQGFLFSKPLNPADAAAYILNDAVKGHGIPLNPPKTRQRKAA